MDSPHKMSPLQKASALSSLKGKRLISALTAYDYPTARILDEEEVDLLLVGDSLGMVVLGYPDTTHVTLDHVLHHTAAVARGARRSLVVSDLPIDTYRTADEALANSLLLQEAGAQAVKLEGAFNQAEKVRKIVTAGIPVVGHLGMLPQRVKEEGGYKKKGKTAAEAEALLEGACALEQAGAFALVLESVLPEVAQKVTQTLSIPTIGIGCGNRTCDGEIAVITDVLGSYPWFVPPFATPQANFAQETRKAIRKFRRQLEL